MVLVALVVVSLAGFAVYRLTESSARRTSLSTDSGAANDITPFNAKHLVLEVFGPPGAVATISYLDVKPSPSGSMTRRCRGHTTSRLQSPRCSLTLWPRVIAIPWAAASPSTVWSKTRDRSTR
jgi:Mycobacterium membrane protein